MIVDLVVDERLVSSAGPIVQLLQESGVNGSLPWRVQVRRTASGDVVDVPIGASEALASLGAGTADRVLLSRRGPSGTSELVAAGFGFDRERIEIRVDIRLLQERCERFFISFVQLTGARHADYVPKFENPVGNQSMVIEMALQRDFAMYGDRPEFPQVQLAKSLATLLPRLRFSVPDPAGLPAHIGWLNYWSAPVASAIGFPDQSKDQRLMPLSRQLDDGAWFVKLTEEPLDLMRPDHVEALAWAYWRFDRVGKRMSPTTKGATIRRKRAEARTAADSGVKRFALRERDANGQWWDSPADLITAKSAEEALKVYFARNAYGRPPKAGESLNKLRKAYDAIAVEVGLTRAADIEAIETQP